MAIQRTFLSMAWAVLWAFGAPLHVRAEPLPVTAELALGSPARPMRVTAEAGREGVILTIGARRQVLAVEGAASVTLQPIRVAAAASVLLVRLEGDGMAHLSLFGGPRGDTLLVQGRADAHGDPGERTQLVIDASDRDGDGQPDVVVGTRHEAVPSCGDRVALLGAQHVSPRTLRLEKGAPRANPKGETASLGAEVVGQPTRSVLRALTPRATSVQDSSGPVSAAPPLMLTDGNTNTAWVVKAPADGAFATFRWAASGFPIASLLLVPQSGEGALPLPSAVWLTTDTGSMRVELDPAQHSAQRVTFDEPLDTLCLSLEIEAKGKASVAIAEVDAHTAIDGDQGLDRLVALLVQDDARADRAASLLAELGHPAALRVVSRYGELDTRGKRRALRVLSRSLGLDEARALMMQAARDGGELGEMALAAFRNAGALGRAALEELVRDPAPVGDLSASFLSQEDGGTAPLLQALGTEAGPSRPALRRALIAAARRDSAAFDLAFTTWLEPAPPVASRAALALVLSHTGQHADRAASVAEAALDDATGFEDRYRLALALGKAGPAERADAWLERAATSSAEWMMRVAAFEALSERAPARATSVALRLAGDTYPRVRAAALSHLVSTAHHGKVEQGALEDPWPLVRRAAVEALATRPDEKDTLQKALEDTSRRVRSAAIDGLARTNAREAWPSVRERLVARGEWPEVQAAAMRFAARLCIDDAREPLAFALRRGIRAEASEDEVLLALEALRALHALGGEAARDAEKIATRESAPEGFAKMAQRLGPSTCSGPKPTAR
jgi:HEAT repeat protein